MADLEAGHPVSARTRELEDAAVAAILDVVPRDAGEVTAAEASREPRARAMYGAMLDALVAKVGENLTGEIATIRRLVDAAPNETTYRAVKRLVDNGKGLLKKYREREGFVDGLQCRIRQLEAMVASTEDADRRGFQRGVSAARGVVEEWAGGPPMASPLTVRAAARARHPLRGADAEGLEAALALTEKERDALRVAFCEADKLVMAQTSMYGWEELLRKTEPLLLPTQRRIGGITGTAVGPVALGDTATFALDTPEDPQREPQEPGAP
jgi:hypothetical protein